LLTNNVREYEKIYDKVLKTLYTQLSHGVVVIDTYGVIIDANPAVCGMFGYTPNELINENVSILCPDTEKPKHDQYIMEAHARGYIENAHVTRDLIAQKKKGTTFHMELTLTQIEVNQQRFVIGVCKDITERKKQEAKIEYMAHHDALTGLVNRALYKVLVEKEIEHSKRNKLQFAVLLIDINNFKIINDTHGHDYGDEILRKAALAIEHGVRGSDTVGRLGGDEFVVLLTNIKCDEDIKHVCAKIIDAVCDIHIKDGMSISPSIGIVTYPHDEVEFTSLMKKADMSMYKSKLNTKQNGEVKAVFWHEGL